MWQITTKDKPKSSAVVKTPKDVCDYIKCKGLSQEQCFTTQPLFSDLPGYTQKKLYMYMREPGDGVGVIHV